MVTQDLMLKEHFIGRQSVLHTDVYIVHDAVVKMSSRGQHSTS